jgi:hypothetical protein
MKVFFLIIVLFLVTGCSYPHPNMLPYGSDGVQKYDDPIIKDTLMAMPIYTITFENQNFPRCHKKGFCALLPKLYKQDYSKPNKGWSLMSSSNGFSINAEFIDGWIDYGINMNSSSGKYEKRERAVDTQNAHYIQYVRDRYNYEATTKMYYEVHGKENYPCIVTETGYSDRGVKTKSYGCYKFNQTKTKAKKVGITFIYTKSPNLPQAYQHLAKEYTYDDLLKRSQRVLDSLYIKDGWDE